MTTTRENIKRILDERATVWERDAKPLVDIAETRAFTAEEQAKWEAIEADQRAYSERIRTLELSLEQERQVADFAAQFRSDTAVRSAIETELRSVLAQAGHGVEFGFTGKEITRALSVGTPTAGGNTVPATFWDQLIQPLRNYVSVLQAGATVITTSSGENLTIPRLSSFGAAAQVAEAGTLAGTDPAFDQTTLKSYKFGEFVGLSRELVEDSAVDIEALIVSLISANIGIALGQKLAVGTGTNQTAGLVTSATVGVTTATGTGGAITFDNVIDLFYSVAAPYRATSSWIIADLALSQIRKLKDTTGQYLWQPSVQIGQPDIILGKAVLGEPNMDAPGLNKKPVAFGDVSKYWVRFVNSLRVERSDQALFGTDQIAFRGVLRADGLLTDPSAVKTIAGAAS